MKKIRLVLVVAIVTFIAIYFIFKSLQKEDISNNFSKVQKVELNLNVPDSLNREERTLYFLADYKTQTIRINHIYNDRKEIFTRSFPYAKFREMLIILLPAEPVNDSTKANVIMYEPDTVKYYHTYENTGLINLID